MHERGIAIELNHLHRFFLFCLQMYRTRVEVYDAAH